VGQDFLGRTSFANCLAAALFRVPVPCPHARRLDLDAVEEGWKELVRGNLLAIQVSEGSGE
ncbi:MAG: hypothetical protein ABSB35_20230, partial [Bryobacteraceae bacterium]